MSEEILDTAEDVGFDTVACDTVSIYLLFAVGTSTEASRALVFQMVRYTPRAQADMRALLRAHRAGRCAARIEHMRGVGRVCPTWFGVAQLHDAYAAIRHLGDDMEAYVGPYENADPNDPYAGVLDNAGHVDTTRVPEHMTFVLRGKEAARLLHAAHTTKRWCVVTPSTRHAYIQASDEDDSDDGAGEGSEVPSTTPAQRTTRADILGARLDIENYNSGLQDNPGVQPTDPRDEVFVLGGDYPAFLADLLTRPDIAQEVASPTDPAVSEVKRTALHAGDTGDNIYNYIDTMECVAFGSAYSTQQEVDNGGISTDPESLTVSYADVYAWLLRMYNRAAACRAERWVIAEYED